MSNAKPEIIDVELKKKADAEAKLKILEENLVALAC
jgi:valyl-tRNA synthetase